MIWLIAWGLSVGQAWSSTFEHRPVPREKAGCTNDFVPRWAFARELGSIHRHGYLHGEDVVGLLALSRFEFWRLLETGKVENPAGIDFFPYGDNPHVANFLDESPASVWNQVETSAQERAAADRSWVRTMIDVFNDRLTKAGVRPDLDPAQMEAVVSFMKPESRPDIHFTLPLDEILKIPEVAGVEPAKAKSIPAGTRLSQNLARRLNMGPDRRDLNRWNTLRAVADAFGVRWTAEARGPALEAALGSYFSALPREAGLVVSLRSSAFARVVWDSEDWPVLTGLNIADVAGVKALGSEELALLKRLPTDSVASDESLKSD